MNTHGMVPIPNVGHGVLLAGNAHGNLDRRLPALDHPAEHHLGEPRQRRRHRRQRPRQRVINSFIGTNVMGKLAAGNAGGVLVGAGSHDNPIGGADPSTRNLISGNLGNGVVLAGGHPGNIVSGNLIGTQVDGRSPLPNSPTASSSPPDRATASPATRSPTISASAPSSPPAPAARSGATRSGPTTTAASSSCRRRRTPRRIRTPSDSTRSPRRRSATGRGASWPSAPCTPGRARPIPSTSWPSPPARLRSRGAPSSARPR